MNRPHIVADPRVTHTCERLVALAVAACAVRRAELRLDGHPVLARGDDASHAVGTAEIAGGTLVLLDAAPRALTPAEAACLDGIAAEIEHHLGAARREAAARGLTSRLVHDLQNAIASLVPNAAFVAEEAALTPDARVAAHDLVRVTESLRRLVTDLQDLANDRFRPKLAPVDLLVPLRAAVSAQAERAREGSVAVAVEAGSVVARADGEIVRRIADDLLDNALRYAPPESRLAITAVRGETGVGLRFTDQGGCVPPAWRGAVFDVHGASMPGAPKSVRWGRALALPYCRAAARAMGGEIEVEGEGDTCAFVLTLPAPI